jgi:hypothetical protein
MIVTRWHTPRVTSYLYFFAGAVTVAGALVGLLFVALSVSPHRLRQGPESVEHQAIAATAFTALVDALFISLIALEPGAGYRTGALVFGLLGLSSTSGLAARLWRARKDAHFSHRWPILLGVIIVIYAAQTATGIGHAGAGTTATFVYIMFAIGIARSWELLGLQAGGLLDLLVDQATHRRNEQRDTS